MFLNSSTRTFDGGVNTFTIRNNIGNIRISSASGGNVLFMTSSSDERMRITSGGDVGINTTAPKTKLDVNGYIGFGSKTVSLSDTYTDTVTVNMNAHRGCYVKITAFGDWSGHSSIAYVGEFFLQNGDSGYNEPGTIISQYDNTSGDDIKAQIVDPGGTGTRDFIIQLVTTSSSSSTPVTTYIQYEVRGLYNSIS
jgi:hypothetical protein